MRCVMKKKTISEAEALKRMAACCARREYCVSDIEEKLRLLNLPAESVRHVLIRLQEEGFIDESRYCQAFVHDKLRFSGWGKRKIAQTLMQKRIPSSVYQPVIDGLDEGEYMEVLRKVVGQKENQLTDEDKYQRLLKVVHFAMRRGFSFDDVRKIMDTPDMDDISD